MKALLLSAGFGTRLRPITNSVPKCLVPIRGKPLLGYWFELLFNADIELAIVNTHYLPEQVRNFVNSSPWKARIKLVHEDKLLGTGGTVRACEYLFADESVMVVHADNLSRFNVQNFVSAHRSRPAHTVLTMMTFSTDAPESCGILELDQQGIVCNMHEKVKTPPGNLANGAVYIFEPEVVDAISSLQQDTIDLSTDVIPQYFGKIATFHNDEFHRDIGTLSSMQSAEQEFSSLYSLNS